VWERAEPAIRSAPGPLSRQAIVSAAIALADQDGLAAVSLRKVGALLGAGPMRLYGYLSTKEELLELMVDAAYGEMVWSAPAEADWRSAVRAIAHRMRQVSRAHPWLIELLGGRVHIGPHALAHLEASLSALTATPGFEDIDLALRALRTVNAYVIGAIRNESSELRAERETGLDKSAWQSVNYQYIERMLATGRFPNLARVVRDASHPAGEVLFDEGLECVLDGIEALLAR